MMEKREFRTPDEILKEALAREEEARDFYGGLATQTSVDFVKKLLERLETEESKHVALVQEMITRLNRGKDIV